MNKPPKSTETPRLGLVEYKWEKQTVFVETGAETLKVIRSPNFHPHFTDLWQEEFVYLLHIALLTKLDRGAKVIRRFHFGLAPLENFTAALHYYDEV